MMFGIKPQSKFPARDEEIQPWSAQESTMLHLIIESSQMQVKPLKNATSYQQQPSYSPVLPNKQRHSYNFNNNLRKYEKMKAENFQAKREVNFIQKNIKGVSQDFMFLEENSPNLLLKKMVQDKQRKGKGSEIDTNSTIEPVNWSLIMWYEENRSAKKHRHKDIQSFLRTQSRSADKRSNRKESEERTENVEDLNKSEAEKYQKLLKLREGLRKRNLKSASESRKQIERPLVVEDNYRTPKLEKGSYSLKLQDNTFTRVVPRTSSSSRNKAAVIKIQRKNVSPEHSQKIEENSSPRFLFTSHRNRFEPKKISLQARIRGK